MSFLAFKEKALQMSRDRISFPNSLADEVETYKSLEQDLSLPELFMDPRLIKQETLIQPTTDFEKKLESLYTRTQNSWMTSIHSQFHRSSKSVMSSQLPGDKLVVTCHVKVNGRDQIIEMDENLTLLELSRLFDCKMDEQEKKILSDSFFFFIENTFYEFGDVDLVTNIQNFLQKNTNRQSADVRIIDVNTKLGSKYVFVHKGNCEHILKFNRLQLVSSEAPKYNQLFLGKTRKRKCKICQLYVATKVTFDDVLAPESPCYFCEDCYTSLHYDSSGVLKNEGFKVFPAN